MNLCKRAFLYSIRKKGKTLTLLAFLLVMATLMLTCFSIQSATETANANIKKALLGYFTINGKHIKEQSLIQKQPSKSEGCFCIYARKA